MAAKCRVFVLNQHWNIAKTVNILKDSEHSNDSKRFFASVPPHLNLQPGQWRTGSAAWRKEEKKHRRLCLTEKGRAPPVPDLDSDTLFFKWLILLFPFSLVADSSRAAWCQGHHNLNAWREIPLKISVRVALLPLLFPQRSAMLSPGTHMMLSVRSTCDIPGPTVVVFCLASGCIRWSFSFLPSMLHCVVLRCHQCRLGAASWYTWSSRGRGGGTEPARWNWTLNWINFFGFFNWTCSYIYFLGGGGCGGSFSQVFYLFKKRVPWPPPGTRQPLLFIMVMLLVLLLSIALFGVFDLLCLSSK